MNKPKHTPGRWYYDEETQTVRAPAVIGDGHWFTVATCDRRNDNNDADARLIASAPETAAERDRLKALVIKLLTNVELAKVAIGALVTGCTEDKPEDDAVYSHLVDVIAEVQEELT